MTLGEWLALNRVSHDEFAIRIGRDRSSVTRYVSGERMPRPAVMSKISQATAGQVTPNDFVAAALDDGPDADPPAHAGKEPAA